MAKEKTVSDIDIWFNGEIKRQLDAMPPKIVEMAKGNKEYTKVIAQSIANKCCFSEKAILKSLQGLLTIIIVLVTMQANGQSIKLKREYANKPITDTAYHYIEKWRTDSDGNIFLWVQDLQTGERFEVDTECLVKSEIPKPGTIKRTLRSKLILEPQKREQ